MHPDQKQLGLIEILLAGFTVGAIGTWAFLYPANVSPVETANHAIDMALVAPPTTAQAAAPSYSHQFGLCFTGGGANCVVDGDTMWLENVKIRIADIYAPETHSPLCAKEADLGNRAAIRLQELLSQGPFDLESINRNEDRYGQKLRIARRDGQSLGMILVREGLARKSTRHRQSWC